MKIKRYTAASMRAALALVRAEQGPDAVILSSRRSDDGMEVIAAVDYDEALFADANRQRPAVISVASPRVVEAPKVMAAAKAIAAPRVIAAPKATAAPKVVAASPAPRAVPQPVPAPTVPAGNLGYGDMQRELK